MVILTNEKIFQFPHSTCRIIGQHALCEKENLIVSEYKKSFGCKSGKDEIGKAGCEHEQDIDNRG